MQHVRILCVGDYKERYWREAEAEYQKRLSASCKLEIICVDEARLPSAPKEAEICAAIKKEGAALLKKIPPRAFVVALCIKGGTCTSPAFAEMIAKQAQSGTPDLCFVIGGSNGLDKAVEEKADFRLSFSPMTFPHQLARVLLLEQLYRAYQILANSHYHK